ncbi:CRISPR-associated protein Cas4, partial [Thermodesulfovibrio sp.]
MHPTGTLIWYYYICSREVWLMSRQLTPWQENPFIEIGRLLSEEAYKRERKEIHLENIVIDLLKTEGENVVIGEVKKSSRFEKSARMQLAFYLWRLKQLGIEATGQLLFPKEKKKIIVTLTKELKAELI